MKRIILAAALGLFDATTGMAADTNPASVTPGFYTVEPMHTRVQFSVSHMGFTNWFGDFTGATGTLHLDQKNVAASSVDISIPVTSISNTTARLMSSCGVATGSMLIVSRRSASSPPR